MNALTGSGHFCVGFTIGAVLMVFLQKKYTRILKVQLYAPFIPFVFGVFAALPYVWLGSTNNCSVSGIYNIFLFYEKLHCQIIVNALFGGLNKVALIAGGIYAYILIRYIALVKYCRRYGWESN